MRGGSDLIGLYVAAGAILVLLAIFVAFFFIGAVAGIIVLLAAVILAIALLARVIRENEVP